MFWLREHPYTSAVAVVALLLFAGAYVVKERSTVLPRPSSTVAWGGGGGFLLPTAGVQEAGVRVPSDLYTRVQNSPPFWYPLSTAQNTDDTDNESSYDFSALLTFLSPKTTSTMEKSNDPFADAYSFIPRGFIATSTPVKERSPQQEALYAYGNEAGAYVQSFEERNRNMARVLKDQFEDPSSPQKSASLLTLAESLAGVGATLLSIENVPEQVLAVNAKLAASYKTMGAKLALVPEAHTDEEKINAMRAHNASVEEFVKSYVAIVTLFSLSEVTFREDEPGSVFMFSGSSF